MCLALVTTLLAATAAPVFGQDVGAVASGNWNTGSIWTTGTVPGSSNNVFIGSTVPSGTAATATVTLTQAQSAANVVLGNGNGTNGTLDLAGNVLTIGGNLNIGQNGGIGTLNEGGGSFTAQSASIGNGSSLAFGANDVVTSLGLAGGASATTAAEGNIASSVTVATGSTLTLGANLNLGPGSLNVQDSGSVFNAQGHSISGGPVFFGANGSSAVTLLNLGNITANQFFVGNGMNFNINSNDTVNQFVLSNGASSTLNSNVTTLVLTGGSTATTTATGAPVGGVEIDTGSTLTLGANLNLGVHGLNIQDSGSVLNAQGHSISGGSVAFGGNGTSAVTLLNLGNVTANQLLVGNGMNFNINANDTVNQFTLATGASSTLNNNVTSLVVTGGSTATTTPTGSATDGVNINSGGKLILGADLNVGTASVNVQDTGSTLNAQGHALTAVTLLAGVNGSAPVSLTNLGLLTLSNLEVGNATALTMHGGDVVNNQINLQGSSVLTVQQTNETGLTLNGTSLSSLTIDPSSMNLIFNVNTEPNWDFRWKDPSSGNWISTIDAMIASGEITITAPNGFQVVDSGGFTYVEGGFASGAIPEPSSLVLACLALAGVAIGMGRARKIGNRHGKPAP